MAGPAGTPTPDSTQQQANTQAPVAPPDVLAQSAGVQQLHYLMSQSGGAPPDTAKVAQLVQANPTDRSAMIALLQQTYGNTYTQAVLTATQATPAGMEPSAIGAPGSGISVPALPQTTPKNPGDKMPSGLTPEEQQQQATQQRNQQVADMSKTVPPPPASAYNDGDPRNGAERQVDASRTGQPLQAPGSVPDAASTQNGIRTTATTTTTNGPGMTVTNTSIKGTVQPGADTSPAATDAALVRYRAAISATLDEQIAALDPKKALLQPATPTDGERSPQQLHDDLVAAKAKVAGASKDELDAMVTKNKLPIEPKDDMRLAVSVTNTKGGNAAGLLDGSAVGANNTKTAVVTATPGGPTVTKTTDDTNEIGTKGVNIARGSSTTTVGPDGSLQSNSNKTALSGGITDPIKLANTKTAAHQDENGGSQTSRTYGATVGNGFGGLAGGASYNKLDPAKNPNPTPAAPAADPNAPASEAKPEAKPDDKDAKQGIRPTAASVNGKVGMIQNDNGTGAQVSLDDARVDMGNKKVAAGAYGAADGSLQMMVTPNDDGGCTITMTAIVRGKLGAFAGKRDPNDPVTSGNETHGGGDAYGEMSRTVVKSRKLSKDEATTILGNLDSLSNGPAGGKKTFGTRAAAQAYSAVFGGSLDDLGKDGEANKSGETVSKIDEKGGGFDLKGGGSTGNDANSRTGGNVDGGFEHVEISGYKESASDTAVTRSMVFGDRNAGHVNASVSEGAAGMTAGASKMQQATRTYVFTVPKNQPALLAELRAIKDEAAVKKFAADHPDLTTGSVKGDIDQNGTNVGVNVGPLAAAGSTTSTVDTNVANGQHTEIGPDGKPIVKKDLSGTADGSRKDDSSVSLLGVKVAQANTTSTSHATVDSNGQTSLDVAQTDSSSNAISNAPKGAKDIAGMDKTDMAATAATGGPMAFVKKLAERVGEQTTVGAHLDDTAVNQLVAIAQGDQKRWSDSILTDYRTEWFTLQHALAHPSPPQAWLDQDDSPNHIAAMQLTRMKAFATFVSVSGPAGQQAIAHVRGEYGPNAVGQTVSFPPSLQDKRAEFDDLTKQAEHLRGTLLGYAQAGDEASGKALIEKLSTGLGALRQKVQDATDHPDPTLGLRAAAGIGDQQMKVNAWTPKFAAAIKAQQDKKPENEIEAALDGQQVATSTQLWHAQEKQQTVVAEAKAKTESLSTTPAADASNKEWKDYNKQYAAAAMDEYNAEKQLKDQHDAETKARADEAKAKAETNIPEFETRCLASKGHAFSLLDQAVGALPGYFGSESTTFDDLMKLGTLMREWSQKWSDLHGAYKDAGHPDGERDDLRPGLISSKFDTIKASEHISDNVKGYAGELKNSWGRL